MAKKLTIQVLVPDHEAEAAPAVAHGLLTREGWVLLANTTVEDVDPETLHPATRASLDAPPIEIVQSRHSL